MEFFDSHTHLDSKDFDEDRDAVIARAYEAGVTRIVNVGATSGFAGAERSIALADSYEFIWATAGIHPHDAEAEQDIDRLRAFHQHPKVVAVGETGLDFYRDWSPRDLQYEWFRIQVELALEVNKPLVIHSRDTNAECLDVLRKMGAEAVGGVFHCYSGDYDFFKEIDKLNFIISVPGTITFKKAEELRETLRQIPLEKIMLETDAPYLAPVPYRGKRCETGYMIHSAQALAQLKNLPLSEIARSTTQTARNFFGV